MDYIQALILSIVEGLTEFLPISSTGHLVLTAELLKIPQTGFVKSFEVIIQLGAIFSIIALYFKTLLHNKRLVGKLLLAFIPTAILGLVFYSIIKHFLLGNIMVTLIALLMGGIFLIAYEKLFEEKRNPQLKSIDQLTYKKAFLIGLFQSISMIPGVSRAGATIVGGLFLGLSRKAAVEFSFLLAVPTMFAATGLDLIKSEFNFSSYEYSLLAVGFVGSFITALLAVKYFLKFIEHHTFVGFGVYRIIAAIVLWFFLM